ncbi:MAG: tetratricopeptide repeat protein, partial [Bryobacteraceae bacterium]
MNLTRTAGRWVAIAATITLGASLAIAQQKQPTPKSEKEVEALQAIFAAQDPDSRIKAADELILKFADTEFKAIALHMAAVSYEQKNDFEKMVIYAERTLQADPEHYMSMIMLGRAIAMRTREHDLDREEKLAAAEKHARSAQKLLETAPKPNPQLTDEQWEGAKKDFRAQTREALALSAMVRKKYDVAVTEFKAAVEEASQPDPTSMVRLAQAYNLTGKHDESLALIEKIMALPDLHPTIRQFAQAERVRATQGKGGVAPKPAADAP